MKKRSLSRGRKHRKGGGGAEEYARSVYGNMGEHTASNHNMINTKINGGKKSKSTKKRRRPSKYNVGGGNEEIPQVDEDVTNPENARKNEPLPDKTPQLDKTVTNNPDEPNHDPAQTNPNEINPNQNGGNVISSLAVPAILLSANQLYKNRQSTNNFNPKFSRKYKKYNPNFKRRSSTRRFSRRR
jgi:hypothetical protein